jgi:hypothetical protein
MIPSSLMFQGCWVSIGETVSQHQRLEVDVSASGFTRPLLDVALRDFIIAVLYKDYMLQTTKERELFSLYIEGFQHP